MVASISPVQLAALRNEGAKIDLIDVRTPLEFGEVHIDFARNVPLDRLTPQAVTGEQAAARAEPLYVICRSGGRGKQACERLKAGGVNAVNVKGGTLAWVQAGLPVVRGGSDRKIISLERQVRIAAGLLVLTGSVFGYFVHPYWIGLAAFVGAGLTFAGFTDACGMGLILAKMPWNRQTSPCAANASGNTAQRHLDAADRPAQRTHHRSSNPVPRA